MMRTAVLQLCYTNKPNRMRTAAEKNTRQGQAHGCRFASAQ
jgi:hypothetical protein